MPVAIAPIRFTIFGSLQSKANSRRLILNRDQVRSIKSRPALDFERTALLQIPAAARQGLAGPIRLTAHIYYSSRRPDLDVSLLQDVLERAGCYLNDRQIHELHLYKHLDTRSPRAEIEIESL